jgi:hypothetical protein
VPPGEHDVTITLALIREAPTRKFRIEDLPKDDLGPWPEGLSLRREDIYDEDGRRRVVVLRVFTKKTQKTPRREIELARQRAKEVT